MEIEQSLKQFKSDWQSLKIQALGPGSWRVSGFFAGQARCLTLVLRPDRSWRLLEAGRVWRLPSHLPGSPEIAGSLAGVEQAPMEGVLRLLTVASGDTVQAGQPLYVLEAMKMQIQVCADVAGRIQAVHAAAGERIGCGQQILTFKPSPSK